MQYFCYDSLHCSFFATSHFLFSLTSLSRSLFGLNIFISKSYIYMFVQTIESTYAKRGFERKPMAYRVHLLDHYFTHIETSQPVGGTKTGVLREKPPGTPGSRPWLVPHLTRVGFEPTLATAMRWLHIFVCTDSRDNNERPALIFLAVILNVYVCVHIIKCLMFSNVLFEPRRGKTCRRDLRPVPTQIGLYSHRRWLETWKSGCSKKRECAIQVAKTKALISFGVTSFAVTANLICVFVFAYAKIRFSHVAAQIDFGSLLSTYCEFSWL